MLDMCTGTHIRLLGRNLPAAGEFLKAASNLAIEFAANQKESTDLKIWICKAPQTFLSVN